jgi:hypothetical protein
MPTKRRSGGQHLLEWSGLAPQVLGALVRRYADLVEPAKANALEKLGEGERAFGIANEWLRTKVNRAAGPV